MSSLTDMGQTRAIISSYVGVLLYSDLVFLGAWKVGTTMSHIPMPAGLP